jgi:hypothetical protein
MNLTKGTNPKKKKTDLGALDTSVFPHDTVSEASRSCGGTGGTI